MADSLKTLASPRATLVYRETAATSSDPDASGNNNVFDKLGSVLYGVKIDATSNTAENVYLCLYHDNQPTGADVTVGTTSPDLVFKCISGSSVEVVFPCGIQISNSEYLHFAVKQEAGTAGSTAPTGTVAVTLLGA